MPRRRPPVSNRPKVMASSPHHLSPLSAISSSSNSSAVVMKFKCVEYGSSADSGRRRQREDPVVSNSTSYYFAPTATRVKQQPNEGGSSNESDEVSSETVDSGLSSDTEGFTPPPLPRRQNKNKAVAAGRQSHHEVDADSQSDVSADSLACLSNDDAHTELTSLASEEGSLIVGQHLKKTLPVSLLSEIRMKAVKLQVYHPPPPSKQQPSVKELGKALDSQLKLRKSSSVPPRSRNVILTMPALSTPSSSSPESTDSYYYQRFHMRENIEIGQHNKTTGQQQPDSPVDDLSFAGLKDILSVEKSGQTIRSHKSGTVRGVRNRVRAGITTFLQGKTFKVSLLSRRRRIFAK